LLAIFVYTWWSFFVFQCNQIESLFSKKCILSTPSILQSMSQKIMIHQKLGNFILFKLCLEPNVFVIAIKVYKRTNVTISSVFIATSRQCIIVPWKIPVGNNQNENFCPLCLNYLQHGIKCPILFFKIVYRYKQRRVLSVWCPSDSDVTLQLAMLLVPRCWSCYLFLLTIRYVY
jgi:hypothetical protein